MFQRESARLADSAYAEAVKERPEPLVILMAGGTASGKSEYVSAYLDDEDAIILDGTLPTFIGAEIKIKKALKASKRVAVRCVLPESFLVAFVAFLNRERKFAAEHFYRTHSNTRKTVLAVATAFPDIAITIIESNVTGYPDEESVMNFKELSFVDRAALIEFLNQQQYTEETIKQAVFE